MIPKVLPPLSGLAVLVTRPVAQAHTLCEQIERYGGKAVAYPTIAIERLEAPVADVCDLAVFISVNAVAHGRHLLQSNDSMRIAAIGKATAAALREAELRVDYVPDAAFTSEALLAHPQLQLTAGARALIVKGEGGRELLQEAFTSRGLVVQTREVYRRVRPPIDIARRETLEMMWSDEGIEVVTLTSVATLDHLRSMLSERGLECLRYTTLLVISERIQEAARKAGLQGEIIVAGGGDDASILGALARWRTRART